MSFRRLGQIAEQGYLDNGKHSNDERNSGAGLRADRDSGSHYESE
ncbi:hypothetical protein I553_8987 [Mycobacterium xenopi 4042]|uniref:Uncharacterized protein n=1 Tax=Mycobacterium xenopi 4042 TaxID=1299334 RepID=X8AP69_MYCXE|nr:hypothetical protein I553_8987 [Mycobacterium xenopi 4042]